jgi:hypothetical protein
VKRGWRGEEEDGKTGVQLPAAASASCCMYNILSLSLPSTPALGKYCTTKYCLYIFLLSSRIAGQRVRQITFGHDAAETCMHAHTYVRCKPSLFDLTAPKWTAGSTSYFYNGSNENTPTRGKKTFV